MAATLTACSLSDTKDTPLPPLTHGKVVDKRGHDSYTTDVYRDVYRQTNCRTVTTNALTMSFTAGRSTTGGSGVGGTNAKPAKPGKPGKEGRPGKRGDDSGTKRVCDRQYMGRKKTGTQFHGALWEVQIKKGKRSRWKEIPTKAEWEAIDLGDHI
ncbi:hypothetical protein PV726_31970 [Streptomyces europaeiscabiei]|uniref:hypothetical protein n=1 Tax=Streptomyces europaeiscabiei TaxID=146819 RepID=UPI0029ACF6B6|nr:hypothetical protein [Streptomyces europaeiscabiei]MDX3694873.1 hypothetical protein [Streptomyces europaeiscabiei]